MYYLNKVVGAFLNPLGIGLLLTLLTVALVFLKKRRPSTPTPLLYTCGLLSVAWLWLWSTGVVGRLVGLPLEREFPPQLAEAMPTADAIVILGGGMSVATNDCHYADMQGAADRAWHGARLYRAGKASHIYVTSEADVMLLSDFGVPKDAITIGDSARNTEEEARLLSTRGVKKILLVTSAWHMRRALLMYTRYAKDVTVVPAAADYMCMTGFARPVAFKDFVPDAMMLVQNAYLFKEWIGYWGYRFLRK